MNTFAVTALFALLAVANAGVLVAPSTKILEGPSTRTLLRGPDGSAIDTDTFGGRIVQDDGLGVVARAAPYVVAAPGLSYSAPTLLRSSPLAYSAPLTYSSSLLSAPLTTGWTGRSFADNVIAGPSGSIVSGRSLAEPWLASGSRIFL